MAKSVPVSWHLKGDVNSHSFTLAGAGTADLAAGSTELRLKVMPSLPEGYDPALSHMICNFTLAGYAAVPEVAVSMRDAIDTKAFVRPRRHIIITDAAGEQVTRLEALTTMEITEAGISVTNHMTGFSRLPSAVSRVMGEEYLVPGPGGTATGVARYAVVLEDGAVLDGMTVVPYRFDRQDVEVTPARRVLADQSCEWAAADEITLRATSRWLTLSRVDETAGA
ncbi:hypothetical protein ACN27F_28955 [Solwaraspora sp. WMMB335]|uniref:hypothetical protein n=1 Tax=Solwaraspora sp. WMMB335 TaxID=3404118 RepID=UPI003B923D1D